MLTSTSKGKKIIMLGIFGTVISLIILIIFLSNRSYDISALYQADTMIVYDGNKEEVLRVINPIELFGSGYFDGLVTQLMPSSWDNHFLINKKRMYLLEFIKNDEVTMTIEILGGSTDKAKNKMEKSTISQWLEADNQYVVLRKGLRVFSFQKEFFENLSEMIEKIR